MDADICIYCQRPLRLFLDPRPGPAPRPNYRCDCEGAVHASSALHDPSGQIWPESHRWLIEHGFPVPRYEPPQFTFVGRIDSGPARAGNPYGEVE